jgi:beta-glucanase (GH16 family)
MPQEKRNPAVAWLMVLLCLAIVSPGALAARPVARPTAQGSFTDHLDGFDSVRWAKADGWTNGSPFDNAWRADHVSFSGGMMDLRLSDYAGLGEPYSSGEYRTTGYYGYGCYEAGFRPVAEPGVVSAFFTFAGPYDNGGNGRHNEIDFEFVGTDTRRVQLNFWTNDDSYASSNEVLVNLGFDAATSLHAYAFKWTSTGIRWYVDGTLIHEAFDQAANPTPKSADSLHKIMMNLWPVDETAAAWAGTFVYPGQPLHALYDWVRYTAGEACEIGAPAQPPDPGDPGSMHVREISTSLDARGTQVIARVMVVNGLGQAVAGATVGGSWSGVITGGDTSRTTDSSGRATFYSSRSRTTGSVAFCVTGVTKSGLAYDAGANLESCETITK